MRRESAIREIVQPWELLASAIAGRPVQVAHGVAREPAWTDGKVIFIDATATDNDQMAAVFVQASLLSAGSLTPAIVGKMTRRPKLASRYLAVEGHRALLTNQALLPPSVRKLVDEATATRSGSPAASLGLARSTEEIPRPPPPFGAIKAARLVAAEMKNHPNAASDEQRHDPRRHQQELKELDEDEFDDDNAGAGVDMFSAVGVSGLFGRLLQRFLKSVRPGEPGGTPGSDAATHVGRATKQRKGASVLSTATAPAIDGVVDFGGTAKYPEWDGRRKGYRLDWCTVKENAPAAGKVLAVPPPDTKALRRPLARLALGLNHCHRRAQGDDIDIDAAIGAHIDAKASSTPDENVYIDSLRRRRDLSVLILLDISGSAGEPDGHGRSIHERQRDAAAAITATLHSLGDRTGLYAYNSQGRSAVQMIPVKCFDEPFNSVTMRRLYSLTPSAYSRLGAAIRHGAAVLEKRGGTSRRLLIVLSDGLAYDHGYDKDYGAADSRHALAEVRHRGTGSLCLTFGETADAESLRKVFGSAAHARISTPTHLASALGALVHSALRSAEVRRRVA